MFCNLFYDLLFLFFHSYAAVQRSRFHTWLWRAATINIFCGFSLYFSTELWLFSRIEARRRSSAKERAEEMSRGGALHRDSLHWPARNNFFRAAVSRWVIESYFSLMHFTASCLLGSRRIFSGWMDTLLACICIPPLPFIMTARIFSAVALLTPEKNARDNHWSANCEKLTWKLINQPRYFFVCQKHKIAGLWWTLDQRRPAICCFSPNWMIHF